MTLRRIPRGALACAAALFLSFPAQAQLFRSYLASTGSDADPCTLSQPCRLLPAALAAVAGGGEIWMLDSANYNAATVNIAKSVTILAVPGALGSVVATGGPAINIATAGVNVALRNLVIVPLPGGGGTNGINMTAGVGLAIENCVIANLAGTGIFVNVPASVRIADTTIRGNAGSGLFLQNVENGTVLGATVIRATISGNVGPGVLVGGFSSGTTTTADIADSTIDANAVGVTASSGHATAVLKVSVRGSRIVRNSQNGIAAGSGSGAAVTLSASSNIIGSNGLSGIAADSPGAKVWASGNTISDNTFGLSTSGGGVIESAGNNAVRNNGTDTIGTITVMAPI